ncbi:MAG TPA: ureidoglycolate lyase [Stellaceae bacterium]|nr:ureidoglycolate lyase [Stellaceae bacterium]
MAETIRFLPVRPLAADAFAPYGQVLMPRQAEGQGVGFRPPPENDPTEAQLVLTRGTPRLWLMHLPRVGMRFSRIARHRRVTQCLGALDGKEWFLAVAPPGDLGDDARPALDDIVAFRVPGELAVKLHVATWHAGPHFVYDECVFFNLENMDTNDRDFHAVDLPVTCAYET